MSTVTKFSPGPWRDDDVSPSGLIDANGAWVGFVVGPQGRANRTLRNAAPELYAAAELALRVAEQLSVLHSYATEHVEIMAELEPVRAALRKAKGAK